MMATEEETVDVSYKIDQILYVVKNMSIEPLHVVEEVTKKTVHGTSKSWIVEYVTSSGEKKRCDIASIKDEIFQTPEKVKKTLIARASMAITNLITDAVKKANQSFNVTAKEDLKPEQTKFSALEIAKDVVNHKMEELQNVRSASKVTLPDGTIANLK